MTMQRTRSAMPPAYGRRTADRIRAATYIEFLYEYGCAPGVDLGRPISFSQPARGVYQQRFERGLTLANVGDLPTVIDLPGLHVDLTGDLRASIVLAPRSAEVLHRPPLTDGAPTPREPLTAEPLVFSLAVEVTVSGAPEDLLGMIRGDLDLRSLTTAVPALRGCRRSSRVETSR